MREILFTGKRLDNGEWIDGHLLRYNGEKARIVVVDEIIFCDEDNISVIQTVARPVDPKTVCQYTGLCDKNGKKIFVGDIVRGRHWTSYYDKNPEDFHLWRVDWSEKSGLITFVDSPTTKARMSIHDFADFEEVEVIGNVHDNQELLEVSHE